jgi:hypothetical protein
MKAYVNAKGGFSSIFRTPAGGSQSSSTEEKIKTE